MVCKVIDSWTFSELVGAFLDVAIVYFLLCGSALAYFASRFLGLFGLSLPCPCNGRFASPTKNANNTNCLQRLLVDRPTNKTANLQASVTKKFPLDLVLANGVKVKDASFQNRQVGSEGEEASCSCASGPTTTTKRFRRHAIRRRRKSAVGNDRTLYVSSFDPLISGAQQTVLESPGSISKAVGNEILEGSEDFVRLGDGRPESADGYVDEKKTLSECFYGRAKKHMNSIWGFSVLKSGAY